MMTLAESFPAVSAMPNPEECVREIEQQFRIKADEVFLTHGVRLSSDKVQLTYIHPEHGLLFSITVQPAKEPKKWQQRRRASH